MERMNEQIAEIMDMRFGRDNVIALATAQDNIPYVRGVNAYYLDGAFYVITNAKSNKMAQLALNPNCAVSGEWFTAQGVAENLGWFGLAKNADIADRLCAVFAEWIDNGHNDLDSTDCIILKIRLTSGILYADGVRHEIDFSKYIYA